MNEEKFNYSNECFADIQLLRYHLDDFNKLSLRQKKLIYYLSKATLYGRDITFDQFGRYNLRIRKLLEVVYRENINKCDDSQFKALIVYLKRLWFSNGIYHHYSGDKFVPEFTDKYLRTLIDRIDEIKLPVSNGETVDQMCNELFPVIFDSAHLPKLVNRAYGEDLVMTSACNFYEGLTQEEVEDYYNKIKDKETTEPISYGLNSRLIKKDNQISELKWTVDGLYGNAIKHIVFWLNKASEVAENEAQRELLQQLVKFYQFGDLTDFDVFSVKWVNDKTSLVDFINGFIEVYNDPLGLKGSWEGIVEYRDIEATKRTTIISDNAQWFEDHSPVNPIFRKKEVKGVSANVVCAAMLGGDEYPSTAIGINLPNADWIRAKYGSKSVTICNIIDAYNKSSRNNGFNEEFVIDKETRSLLTKYGDLCNDLHTDLHECLGHGSGVLCEGTSPDSLKDYASTIEEARADLYGLYFLGDEKLIDLGLMPNNEAFKAGYYSFIMNGMLTQMSRIKQGCDIQEAHMRDRALIANWCYDHSDNTIEKVYINGKTFIRINDYRRLRILFAELLAIIQRVKSEGDYHTARELVEHYAVKLDKKLHREICQRYSCLHLAPFKGFINPRMLVVKDETGEITDIKINYTETYEQQMLRYSNEYGTL